MRSSQGGAGTWEEPAIFFFVVLVILRSAWPEGLAPAAQPQTDVGFLADVMGAPPHPTSHELEFDHISYVNFVDYQQGITHGYTDAEIASPLASATWQDLAANAERLATN